MGMSARQPADHRDRDLESERMRSANADADKMRGPHTATIKQNHRKKREKTQSGTRE